MSDMWGDCYNIQMPTRKFPLVFGEYYHIYNRGNSKQKIFLDDADRERFIKCLYVCNSNKNFKFRDDIVDVGIEAFEFDRGVSLVSIGAWVLMPNHFHIYLCANSDFDDVSHMSDMWEKGGRNPISEFLRKLLTSYSKYFNKKYGRTGSLFEGSFKSEHVDSDMYAKYLFSYIHLNPIKLIDKNWRINGIENVKVALNFLDTYKWSSYLDYREVNRMEGLILQTSRFPKYFENLNDFNVEILDWINHSPHVGHVGG